MGKVSEYAFVNAKLRARIGEMNTSTISSDMIKAPTLNEAISVLKDTKYSSLVSVYSETGDLQAVELALMEYEIEDFRNVISYLKGNEKYLIETLLSKAEEENIKNALRLWYSSAVRNHQIAYRANYIYKKDIVNHIDYNALINSSGWDGVVASFKDSIYYDLISSISFDEIRANGLFDLEIKLDHLYFRNLFSSIGKLKGEDRKVSEDIYYVDVDLKNILLFVRYSFYHHLSQSELKAVVIPYGKVYEGLMAKKSFDKIDSIEDVRSVASRHYKALMQDLGDIRKNDDDMTGNDENAEHIVRIEEYLGQTRKKEFLKILSQKPFNVGTILSYFFLLRDEEQRIRSIMSAKFYKWDEERIRGAVL